MNTDHGIETKHWDFFIAHSHKDKELARQLYTLVKKNNCTVFLDQVGLDLGKNWDIEIPKAQRHSSITIALISGSTSQAYYAREEIQTAIHLTRNYPDQHKIIPVYLVDDDNIEGIVYGLRLIQGIRLSSAGSMENLAAILCKEAGAITTPIDASEMKEQHILLSFPPGPLVDMSVIPRSIIDMYASLIKETEAKLVVSEANSFRQEASPDTTFIIPLNRIPSPEKIAAFDFWMEVFDYARKQGPRMLAAILLVVPSDQFNAKIKEARKTLLEFLKNHS